MHVSCISAIWFMLLRAHLLPHCFCMFHATSSFYIGLRIIGTLFQFLHYLSIGTTIQSHHQNHRNTDDSSNEPQNPVPMVTIQNKPQNLKTQIKPEQPEDLKRELKALVLMVGLVQVVVSLGRSQKRIEG